MWWLLVRAEGFAQWFRVLTPLFGGEFHSWKQAPAASQPLASTIATSHMRGARIRESSTHTHTRHGESEGLKRAHHMELTTSSAADHDPGRGPREAAARPAPRLGPPAESGQLP
eukprot:678600-Prymnesium_polylepis.1